MDASNVHLSPAEMALITDADLILTKNVVLEKTRLLMENIRQLQYDYVNDFKLMHNPFFTIVAKISKGENYKGLPYLILDYPRFSVKGDFLFIRIFFWWGNFFSITLQAGEKSKLKIAGEAIRQKEILAERNFYLGIHSDPWIHHFLPDNYLPIALLDQIEIEECTSKSKYIKIAAKWPLLQWHSAESILFDNWKFLLEIIV